nr:ABC transporter ATPase [Methylobacterium brachythecii]
MYRLLPILAVVTALSQPALADSCGDLAIKVGVETGAAIGERIEDFVRFAAGADMTLSLSCGGSYPSSVGAQFRGETPPAEYYALFGKAGHAVTGIAADMLSDAARKAQAEAQTRRHSKVPAGGVQVTCSFTKSDKGTLTMCAAIEQADRS